MGRFINLIAMRLSFRLNGEQSSPPESQWEWASGLSPLSPRELGAPLALPGAAPPAPPSCQSQEDPLYPI